MTEHEKFLLMMLRRMNLDDCPEETILLALSHAPQVYMRRKGSRRIKFEFKRRLTPYKAEWLGNALGIPVEAGRKSVTFRW